MPKTKLSPQPLVSVVILNWNGVADTIECVQSIHQQSYKNIEVIVVDNGSVDNSVAELQTVKGITLIKNETNRGFTGGHIDGLKHTAGEYVFVLNNDAVVHDDYIHRAVDLLEQKPSVAVVGGRSYDWRKKSDLYDTTVPYYSFQTINPVTGEGIFERSDNNFAHKTCWVSGSAMIIRRKALEHVGYFYDPMFAYYEESDLFARMLTRGYDIVYSPDLQIWHKAGASSSSSFQLFQLFRNRAAFATRNFNGKDLRIFMRAYLSGTLRGTYHHFKQTGDSDTRQLNKAQAKALADSVIKFPKWIYSKRAVNKVSGKKGEYVEILRKFSTGLSLVYSSDQIDLTNPQTITALKDAFFHHYRLEVIIVAPNEFAAQLQNTVDRRLPGYPVVIVANQNQSATNSLNLGWLASAQPYVTFPNSVLSLSGIDEIINDIASKEWCAISGPSNFTFSRNLLALFGGLIDDDKKKSLDALYDFASQFKLAYTQGGNSNHVGDEIRRRIITTIHEYKSNEKQTSKWTKILEKNYRIYQANNLVLFLTLPGIDPRLRAGRVKNVVLSALRADRKNLALELKHMNNEIVMRRNHGFDRDKHLAKLVDQAHETQKSWQSTPVFVICRDRLSTLQQLLNWCEKVGLNNIYLIDNDSAYPDLIEFLRTTKYQVIRTRKNIGHTVPWAEGVVKTVAYGQYYIVTDPDVIPDKHCPNDVIEYFYNLHAKYKEYDKVGFGLKIDDLPDHYALKNDVINWEQQFWKDTVEDDVFIAGVDTTFALYKPYTHTYKLHPSLRTGRPYVASHLPWYVDSKKIDPEEAFYRLHASQDITSWNTDEILDRYKKELKKK